MPPSTNGPSGEPLLAPSFEEFLTWDTLAFPVMPALAAFLAAAYIVGATRLWAQGRRWSVIRTVCFLLGCALLLIVTGTRIDAYGLRMLSVFIFQQLTLMMVIPPLFILGSPGTLLLRATPHRFGGKIVLRAALFGLRSRVGRAALHPALVVPLMILSLFGLYLGGVANIFLASWLGHIALEVGFLIVGVVVATPLVSGDPLPRRTSFVARIFDAVVEMQLHAAFALVLIFASTALIPFFNSPPPGLGVDPLQDQRLAGTLVWTYGELPVVLILIITLVRWQRQDTVRAARASKRADAEGDPDLDGYNDYLQSLQSRR